MKKLINICCPAAGLGGRYKDAGFSMPKPLIDVAGKPMICWVLENFRAIQENVNLCLIVQREHNKQYNFAKIISDNFNFAKVNIVEVDGLTDGALTTIMKAEKYFVDSSLICINSDQFHEDFSPVSFLVQAAEYDGAILTFEDDNPKWSFAEVDAKGFVKRVAEKQPISTHATTGLYYFKNVWEFCNYAEVMDYWNIRHMGEKYLCPIFNEYCRDGKRVISVSHPKDKFWGLGIPADLEIFKNNYLKENV